MNEASMRQLYVDLQPGDCVEIVHHVKIGFRGAFDMHGRRREKGASPIWNG